MSLVGNWNYPTSIRFGAGRIKELPDACKAMGFKRPLLVTDPGLAKLNMIGDATTALRKAGIEVAVFSEVKPNPLASNVEAPIPSDCRWRKCSNSAGSGSRCSTCRKASATNRSAGRPSTSRSPSQ